MRCTGSRQNGYRRFCLLPVFCMHGLEENPLPEGEKSGNV
jgi:hypothetical protein